MTNPQVSIPFSVRDCALIAIATGKRAQNLRELHDQLLTINPGSIYYHFWGSLLVPRFEQREYTNDFAVWAHRALRDERLAERLAVIDPTAFSDLELLRLELVEVIEQRLDESEHVAWSKVDEQFEFIRSQIVVFDARRNVRDPEAMAQALPSFSPTSIFFHLIDSRRRSPENVDDFRRWLASYGDTYDELCRQVAGVDPFFRNLPELRQELAGIFADFFGRAP